MLNKVPRDAPLLSPKRGQCCSAPTCSSAKEAPRWLRQGREDSKETPARRATKPIVYETHQAMLQRTKGNGGRSATNRETKLLDLGQGKEKDGESRLGFACLCQPDSPSLPSP